MSPEMKSLLEVYQQNRVEKTVPIMIIDQYGNYQQYLEETDSRGLKMDRKRLRKVIDKFKKNITSLKNQ